MAVSFSGAIVCGPQIERHYSIGSRLINSLVDLLPSLLEKFRREPRITITESFTRDGVPLSPEEIIKVKEEMVRDAVRDFNSASLSWEETPPRGELKHATITYGADGAMTKEIGDVVRPVEEKIAEIEAIRKETKASLAREDIDIANLKQAILINEAPLKMACRVARVTRLLDHFTLSASAQQELHRLLKGFVVSSGVGRPAP